MRTRNGVRRPAAPPSWHAALWPVVLLALVLALGCARGERIDAPYPHESMLTIVGELQIFLRQDPYLTEPGSDLQGRNIYRVSLERLGQLDQLAGSDYGDVLAFARGECLERLGDWPGATSAFATVASQTSATSTTTGTALIQPLREQAAARQTAARRMADLTDRAAFTGTLEGYLNDLDVLERSLAEWQTEQPAFPYASFVRIEMARTLADRVRLLFNNRMVLEDGARRAIELAQRLSKEHAQSWRASEYELLSGGIYEDLARDLSAQQPPEGPAFDPAAGWQGLIDQARAAYNRVAQADGDPAKLEGQGRLRALDAYATRVLARAR